MEEFIICLPVADASQVKTARDGAQGFFSGLRVTSEDVEELKVIVGELCMNSVMHSKDVEGNYELRIEVNDSQVSIFVTDYGTGFCDCEIGLPGTEREDCGGIRIGGFGIPLISQLSEYTHHPTEIGTRIEAKRKITYEK